jgi:ribose transport system substrate-binding protein
MMGENVGAPHHGNRVSHLTRRLKDAGLLTAALMILALTSCQRDATSPEPALVPQTGVSTTPEGGGAVEGMTIALVPKGTTHVFWQTVKKGAEDAAAEVGARIEFKGPASEEDIIGQISIIENLTSAEVDGIVMAACDADDLIAPLARAKDAGIPIAVIDSGINDDSIPVTYAATDNVLGGQRAAEALMELIGPQGGKVAVIPFIQGAQSSDERERGFVEEIQKHPEFELLPPLYSNSLLQEAVKVVENLLNAHPDVKGIFAANEPGAMGAARVLEQRGLAGQVTLVGFDAAEPEIEGLEAGTIQALIVQDPYRMGYEGVMAVVKAIKGETVEPKIDTGVTVVTADNLEDPEVVELLSSQAG